MSPVRRGSRHTRIVEHLNHLHFELPTDVAEEWDVHELNELHQGSHEYQERFQGLGPDDPYRPHTHPTGSHTIYTPTPSPGRRAGRRVEAWEGTDAMRWNPQAGDEEMERWQSLFHDRRRPRNTP